MPSMDQQHDSTSGKSWFSWAIANCWMASVDSFLVSGQSDIFGLVCLVCAKRRFLTGANHRSKEKCNTQTNIRTFHQSSLVQGWHRNVLLPPAASMTSTWSCGKISPHTCQLCGTRSMCPSCGHRVHRDADSLPVWTFAALPTSIS